MLAIFLKWHRMAFTDYDFLTMCIGVWVTSTIRLKFMFCIYVMSRVFGFKHICSK